MFLKLRQNKQDFKNLRELFAKIHESIHKEEETQQKYPAMINSKVRVLRYLAAARREDDDGLAETRFNEVAQELVEMLSEEQLKVTSEISSPE